MEQRRERLRRDELTDTVSLEHVDAQERRFAHVFAGGDLALARDLYDPDVVYLSPTTRLFDRRPRIEGVEATLEFIQLTITGCTNIEYRADERALVPGGAGAFVRVVFDWDMGGDRLRSTYAVLYRYRHGRIARQELYYDPGARFERVAPAAR